MSKKVCVSACVCVWRVRVCVCANLKADKFMVVVETGVRMCVYADIYVYVCAHTIYM
jgi:hypothetical protein